MNYIEIVNKAPQEEPARQFYFIDELKKWYEKKTKELGRGLTANIQTLGCQMNARDSEKIEGILRKIGYIPTDYNDNMYDLITNIKLGLSWKNISKDYDFSNMDKVTLTK